MSDSTNTQSSAETRKRPSIGAEITDIKTVPKEMRDTAVLRAASKAHDGRPITDENGKEVLPQVKSAKENGSYRGPVVLNSDKYIVQAVGRQHDYLIVHDKENVKLQGDALQTMNAERRMNGFNIQVHYDGDKGKAYPYSPQKEAERRQAARAEHAEQGASPRGVSPQDLAKGAQEYAQSQIKNAKQREAFLAHIQALSSQTFAQPDRSASTAPAKAPEPVRQQAQPEHSR